MNIIHSYMYVHVSVHVHASTGMALKHQHTQDDFVVRDSVIADVSNNNALL